MQLLKLYSHMSPSKCIVSGCPARGGFGWNLVVTFCILAPFLAIKLNYDVTATSYLTVHYM